MHMLLKVMDIETIYEEFSITISDPGYKNPLHYRVNQYTNQVDGLVKYLLEIGCDYWVGFNNVSFDSQVLQFIINSKDKWVEKTGLEISALIWRFAQDVIDDTNNGLFPPYRERDLWGKQIDLFKIHHYDNENKRTSLKWLEFTMRLENIEEMPIHHCGYRWEGERRVPCAREGFGQKEYDEIDVYRGNDVKATCVFLEYTLGDVESETYKGKNKIQDRLDAIDEFKLPLEAMNWSDVKMGDELNKLGYMQLTGIKDARTLIELKKNSKRKKKFTFGDCIPSYVSFKTPTFLTFFERMKKEKVSLVEKQEYPFSYNGTSYMIAKGGIHSNEKNRIVQPNENELYIDCDISSQYPTAIFKRKLYPHHLGPEWLVMYGNTIKSRLEFKKRGKTDPRAKGIAEMKKLQLNGGGFGMTNLQTNWQYDPFVQFSCTIGNQFEILMLVEMLELSGIHVISANTDGLGCLLSKEKEGEYFRVCKEWEIIVGNTEMGELEFTKYSKMVQSSVNDYIAIKLDGEVKQKGDFCTDYELHKNSSRAILAIAYKNYFVSGVPAGKTIKEHQGLMDFCIGLKASRNYYYKSIDPQTNKEEEYSRLVRYFISEEGNNLVKVKKEGSEATGPEISKCEAREFGYWWTTEVNNYKPSTIERWGIDYQYYIEKATTFISSIERGTKKKTKKGDNNKDQTSLF